MKYIPGALATDMSGRLGGLVFCKTSQNPYIKGFKYPTNSPVAIQTERRSDFQKFSSLWRQLTLPKQFAWNQLANWLSYVNNIGQAYKISGFNTYMKVNLNLKFIGLPYNDVAPLPGLDMPNIPSDWNFEINVSPGVNTIIFNFLSWTLPKGYIVVSSTGTISNGINKPFIFKNFVILDDATLSGEEIQDEYFAKFGDFPLAGQRVYFKIFAISPENGLATTPVKTHVIAIV